MACRKFKIYSGTAEDRTGQRKLCGILGECEIFCVTILQQKGSTNLLPGHK